MPPRPASTVWKFSSRRSREGTGREGELVAHWEVSGDPISDDYTPDDISAADLLSDWAGKAREQFPNGLVPIYWSVVGAEIAVWEAMPFQFEHFPGQTREDFLTFFTWPVSATTGDELNWLSLPVRDKLWNESRGDKGGFIQQATGWKPSILQPFVYLPTLLDAVR